MMKISKNLATALIIISGVATVLTTKYFVRQVGANSETVTAKIKGDIEAPIKIIEYIDFQCPACAFGAAFLKETMEKYPEAIRLEVKHFPLQMHKHGFLSSQYVECAARQGKFWDFQDAVLARQNNWKRLADASSAFEQIAKENQLDSEMLNACLKDDSINEMINESKEGGKKLGVNSTPTYFVNGKMVVGKKSLDAEIKKLLEEYGI